MLPGKIKQRTNRVGSRTDYQHRSPLAHNGRGTTEPRAPPPARDWSCAGSAQDYDAEVRQSAFALLGDLAGACFPYLMPVAHDFITVLHANMSTSFLSVCNNAVWSLGEIAIKFGAWEPRAGRGANAPLPMLVKCSPSAKHGGALVIFLPCGVTGDNMRSHIPVLMPPLTALLLQRTVPQAHESLLENTAITIGRLGYVCPDLVSRNLEQLFVPLCVSESDASGAAAGPPLGRAAESTAGPRC